MPTTNMLMSLFESTLKSSALVLLAIAVTSVLRRAPAALRHLVWVMAIGASLAIPLLPSILPAWRVLPAVPTFAVETHSNYSMIIEPVSMDESGPVAPTRPSATTASKAANLSWQAAAILLWLLGVICWASYYAVGRFQLRRLARRSSRMASPCWTREAESIAAQMGIRRPMTLLCSSETEIPLTFGIIRPKIVLPTDAAEWREPRVRAVLQHEMAHIARFDTLTLLLSHVAAALYWFNPLMWIAAKSAHFERERSCDDQVLAAGSVPSEYASDLLEMATNTRGNQGYAVALAMTRRSQIEGRLVALLNPGLSHQGISRSKTMLIMGVAALLVLPLGAISSGIATPLTPPAILRAMITPPVLTRVATKTVPRAKATAVTPIEQRSTGFECGKRDGSGSSHISSHSDSDQDFHTWNVSWSIDGCSATLNSQGEITFDDAYTTIRKLSNDAFVEINSNVNGDIRHLSIRPSQDGTPNYVWTVNGAVHDFDNTGFNWLTNFMVALDRKTAAAVNQRFPRLMQEGGPQRVLEEVSYMESDHARGTYLLKLLRETSLDDAVLLEVLRSVPHMKIDSEVSRVLIEVARRRRIEGRLRDEYVMAAQGIRSEGERTRALRAIGYRQ